MWERRGSSAALAKVTIKVTADGLPVYSLRSLLADLAAICAIRIRPAAELSALTLINTATPVQRRAFELLGICGALG